MCTNTTPSKRNRNVRDKVYFEEQNPSYYFEEQHESFDKSSSSSLSWGDDCEQEATQQVKHEYEKMHRVLKGLEPIPPNYDKDEYKLWIKTFPSLRSSIQTEVNNRKRSYPTTPISSRILYNKPVQPVIDEFITKLCHRLSNSKPKRPERRERRKTVDNPTEMLEKDFQSLLRISPAPTFPKSVSVGTRNLLNCTTEEEYTSLPYLQPKTSIKDVNLRRKRTKSKNLLLPPIEVTMNQFRSVSALPLQQGKCLSAISIGGNANFKVNNENEQSLLSSARVGF